MAVNRFNNNMFQFEDFDMSGIMNPELVDVMEMRKEANLARGNATDQYEADVADFKNIQATEAEQGIASLPNAPSMPNIPTIPNIDYTNLNPTLFGYDLNLPDTISSEDFQFEDIDMTGMVPDMPIYTNPYAEVFTPAPVPAPAPVFPNVPGEPEPVYVEPAPVYIPPVETVYIPPVETSLPEAEDSVTYTPPVSNDTGETTPYVPPENLPDYPFVDPETGGDYVLVPGTPVNPGPGVVVTDPVTGELPPGFVEGGGDGPAGTIVEPYIPPPRQRSYETVIPFERPLDNVMAGYTRPMDPSLFGSTPGFEDSPFRQQPTGMKGGGRVPMGNNNMLNSGLSRLPLNQQNDTLTQVFQSGFRPRR